MPPPRKIDLIPEELRRRLAETLLARGFSDIMNVTEELNFWLEAEGLELRLGKSAVGEYSKLLRDQRAAFGMAEALLDEATVEREGALHKALMNSLATQALRLIQAVRESEADGEAESRLAPKDLAALGKMLKDLMQSAGWREKLLEGERARLMKEAAEKASEAAASLPAGSSPEALAAAIRRAVTGS